MYSTRQIEISVQGKETLHPKYGKQYKIVSLMDAATASIQAGDINPSVLAKFIEDSIYGIGSVRSAQLVNAMGGVDGVMKALETGDSKAFNEAAEGTSLARYITYDASVDLISRWHNETKKIKVVSFFADIGVTGIFPVRFWEEFGEGAIETVKANPYILIERIDGIGFKRADEIAHSLGIKDTDPVRIQAGLLYTLSDSCNKKGNSYLPWRTLITRARKLLNIHPAYVEPELTDLESTEEIVVIRDAGGLEEGDSFSSRRMDYFSEIIAPELEWSVYLKPFYIVERRLAEAIKIRSLGWDKGSEIIV